MEKLKLYLGGSLFTEAERNMREKEYKEMVELFGEEVEIYSPMHNDDINDKSKEINSEDIFIQDTREVIQSDFFYCNLEELDKDPGLAMESGIVLGCNIVLDMMDKIIDTAMKDFPTLTNAGADKLIKSKIMGTLLNTIPSKAVYVNATDIRLTHPNPLIGLKKDASVNQYCLGGLETTGAYIGNSSTEVINTIKKQLDDFNNLYEAIGGKEKDEAEMHEGN